MGAAERFAENQHIADNKRKKVGEEKTESKSPKKAGQPKNK